MDKRPRILIVEDIENARETWCAVFNHERYRADGAGTAEEAISAIERTTYHVALVDIMLGGPHDTSHRGGVRVLQYMREMREPTLCLVLSGQKRDINLVRDLLKDYSVYDYVPKWDVDDLGTDLVIQKVKDAVAKSPLINSLSWYDLIQSLLDDSSETQRVSYVVEHKAVSDWQKFVEFRGGEDNIHNSFVAACQHLVPLFARKDHSQILNNSRLPNVLSGLYWSKGQGVGVEIVVYGRNCSREAINKEWRVVDNDVLYDKTKAELSVLVLARPDLSRSDFSAILKPSK